MYNNVIMWPVLFNQFVCLLGNNLYVNDIKCLFRMETEMDTLDLSIC